MEIDNDTYVGVFEADHKRGVEPKLKPIIKDYQGITMFTVPGTKIPNNSSTIYVEGSGGYPFLEPFAPNIDFGITIKLKLNIKNKYIQVSVSGEHNFFPAYECIINDEIVYSFMPEDAGPGFQNLTQSKSFASKTKWISLTDTGLWKQ